MTPVTLQLQSREHYGETPLGLGISGAELPAPSCPPLPRPISATGQEHLFCLGLRAMCLPCNGHWNLSPRLKRWNLGGGFFWCFLCVCVFFLLLLF